MCQPLDDLRTEADQQLAPKTVSLSLFSEQDEAVVTMRHGENPSKLESLVEDRPQGRHFLYAQVSEKHNPQASAD